MQLRLMPPFKRKPSRVQFLPVLPSNDIAGWVNSLPTRVSSERPGQFVPSRPSSQRGTSHPTAQGGAEKKRRKDFPVVRVGGAKPCHADDELTPNQLRGALDELVSDMYASSSRAPRDALLNTWKKFHAKWFGNDSEILPITEEKLLKVSYLFKQGGYKSVKNYLSRIKEYHITSGYDWSDRLDVILKKCARSVLRGLGGAHRSEPFELLAIVNKFMHETEPLVLNGPINPVAMIVTSTLFMLREVEASALEVNDITFTDQAVSLRLPVSKVDWQAKGCTRTWHCLCDRDLPCVMHILKDHVNLIDELFHGTEMALFPTAAGSVCTKQSVVDTIRRAVDLAGGSAKDASGNWRISGHTFRITGARTLCRWGLDPITIQLIGRWGSSAVLTYLAEAPLEGFHHRVGQPGISAPLQHDYVLQETSSVSDLDLRADMRRLVEEHNALAIESRRLKSDLTKVALQLEDNEHKQERLKEEEERGVFTRQMEEEARLEEDEHERAFWDNPLQNVEREVVGLKMIPLMEPECVELDKCISAITGPFAEELREKRDAFESNVQRKKDAMMTRQEMEAEELRQMRWEEWRQRKADAFWARHEAKEREWMMREDPRLKHEAFMQEVLLATEKFEQECMEAAEHEQREVEEWNANLEAAERSVMAVEDFLSFEAGVWENLRRKEPESRVRELRVMAQEEYKQREVEETNLRLEALFLELMQKEEERQRKVEEWQLDTVCHQRIRKERGFHP
eukprot:s4904_g4.t1